MNKIIITADSGVDPVDEDLMISGTINSSNGHSYKDVKEIEPYDIIYRKENGEVFLLKVVFILFSSTLSIYSGNTFALWYMLLLVI